MMNDLDALRTEVREAVGALAALFSFGPESPDSEYFRTIRAELLRLATIEADALIALDCEHDWQVEHKRAEKAEAELAAIKARISESVIATVSEYGVVSGVDSNLRSVRGKRVRLVVEE